MPRYDSEAFDPPAPVARVTLCTEDGGKRLADVVMQIDCGCDTSFIPRSAIRLLGLDEGGQEDYEVTAFDGRTSVAKAVRCELIFLRRAFRGTYLVVDNSIGLLGRDVLNHVSLLLDGPDLTWREAIDTA
jgi:hypothetical protein